MNTKGTRKPDLSLFCLKKEAYMVSNLKTAKLQEKSVRLQEGY